MIVRGGRLAIVLTRLDRVTQYAAASRFIMTVSGILGRPVKSGDNNREWVYAGAWKLIKVRLG